MLVPIFLNLLTLLSHESCHKPTLLKTCSKVNSEWTHIGSYLHHSVALTKKGEMYTWGYNDCGRLGHGEVARTNPGKIESLAGSVITHIISCCYHQIAYLTGKGEVFTSYIRP